MSFDEKAVHLAIDLTTTQEKILAGNPRRRYVLLVNDSDTNCYLSLGVSATVNQGIRLNSGGGSYEINLTNPFYGALYAVSGGATKRLSITEVSN